MTATPLQCPTCRKVAHLTVDEFTPASSTAAHSATSSASNRANTMNTAISGAPARRRRFSLVCPSGCTPSRGQLERLADPMAC